MPIRAAAGHARASGEHLGRLLLRAGKLQATSTAARDRSTHCTRASDDRTRGNSFGCVGRSGTRSGPCRCPSAAADSAINGNAENVRPLSNSGTSRRNPVPACGGTHVTTRRQTPYEGLSTGSRGDTSAIARKAYHPGKSGQDGLHLRVKQRPCPPSALGRFQRVRFALCREAVTPLVIYPRPRSRLRFWLRMMSVRASRARRGFAGLEAP